ncbi:hypothetical protein [Ornithinimicrobium pekingense]|uniref:Uncharacterized protein n=1 Tax=Ornithinimicrobium pekingense TaxID=384677 RepID=A0ABQ2F9Q3_9MICO|nr:hypothetical protein [Ornithinimicrobium pekingense]GGK66334.1 hypothetical protein GCM10011509_13280 [Ornithinimicrobium pekingense]
MTPTTRTVEDLRRTLHETADSHPAPSPTDLLRDLREERSRRRQAGASRGAVAAAAAVVVGAAGMQLLTGDDPTPAPPAEGTGSAVERGWVLDDGTPPEQADGLLLLETVPVPYGGADDLTLPGPGGATSDGSQRFAVLWCEVGPDDSAITPPSLRLRTPAGPTVEVPCLPEDDPSQVTVTPVPLPPGEVTLAPTWRGDVPGDGEAVLGIYREASSAEYDFPGWPDPPLTPPAHGPDAVVLDPGSAAGDGTVHGGARAATVTLTSDSSLELWRGVPGGLQVDVDGVRVTDDGDSGAVGGDAWQEADPELRDGVWDAFTAGQRRTLALPEEVLPGPGETRTVTVTVVPRAGEQHWQVAVLATGSEPAAVAPTAPSTGATSEMPQWYAGHRLVATWQVPRTGVANRLELPDELGQDGAEATWALRCPGVARDGGVVATGRVTVDEETLERVCSARTQEALYPVAEAAGYDGTVVTPGSEVRVAVPADPEGGIALVAAYVPVPFEEFDFEAAAEAPQGWDPLAAVRGEVTVGHRLDPAGLTDGTVTEVTLPPDTVGVRLTTEGVGRVRLLVDGSPAEGWGVDQDGWWTSWTDDRVTSVPVAWVQAPSDGGELTLEVDGYPGGAVEAEVLVVVPE